MAYQISITPEEIEKLPLEAFKGVIKVITEPGPEFEKAIRYLHKQKIVGFDTESRPVFTPGQHNHGVALLQLSGPDKAYLFRVGQMGMLGKISKVLSDSSIIKVGAACMDDVRGLQKIEDFSARNFVDLQRMVWEYGIKDKSVKKMSAIILGVRISKTQQLSNWEADTLSEAQQKYAATDAWICREMYLKLSRSKRSPLTPEQMMTPEHLAKVERLAREEAERQAAAAAAPKKKRRRRHHKKKKAAVTDPGAQGVQQAPEDNNQ